MSEKSLLKGYQVFHKFAITYEVLKGKTSSEVGRIKITGNNRWFTSIQNRGKSINESKANEKQDDFV